MEPTAETPEPGVRLDRWLVAVRVFKSRSLAVKAIAGGKVKIDDQTVKAHRPVQLGDAIDVRRDGRTYRYVVKGLLEKRVGAALARENYELIEDPDLTPDMREMVRFYRDLDGGLRRAKGRPSKKDRRLIRKLKGE